MIWCLNVCVPPSKYGAGSSLDLTTEIATSLGSVQRVTTVVDACHSALDLDCGWIDLELPAEALPFRRSDAGSPVLGGFRVRGIRSASSVTTDGKNVFLKGNLQVTLVNVGHFNGQHETGFVFSDRNRIVFVLFKNGVGLLDLWCHAVQHVAVDHGPYRGSRGANAHRDNLTAKDDTSRNKILKLCAFAVDLVVCTMAGHNTMCVSGDF